MRFKKHVPEDKRQFLIQEFNEYIKVTPMTKEEKEELIKWVSEGNSVYENGSGVYVGYNNTYSFLDDYRHWQEEYEDYKKGTVA